MRICGSKLKILVTFLYSYDINFTVVDIRSQQGDLSFENRRKGGMKVHLRFRYANKKYDSILFRGTGNITSQELMEYLNERIQQVESGF